MKVTLNTEEIKEAVQHYINNVLGSQLRVEEIQVVQGRESNGSRIEVELSKGLPIDLDICDSKCEPVNEIQESQEAVVKANPKPVKEEVVTEPHVIPKVEKEDAEVIAPVVAPIAPASEEIKSVSSSFFLGKK